MVDLRKKGLKLDKFVCEKGRFTVAVVDLRKKGLKRGRAAGVIEKIWRLQCLT